MGAGLKKDLRVFRVGPREFLNALFFFFPLEKKGGISTLGERSTTESCMLCSGRINHSQKEIY
ncbi:hypothetical protein ES288_A11G362300v1 [Gossypium darwinii]|uniref:Uncharacterized protein n=1 Tax=Gossypium darwinii TaxID=34276 RepID=A0A5D2EUB0_GOSDA|nr:hypothetical protein ES288_A11G362300v1 [Gossypium darwinii]